MKNRIPVLLALPMLLIVVAAAPSGTQPVSLMKDFRNEDPLLSIACGAFDAGVDSVNGALVMSKSSFSRELRESTRQQSCRDDKSSLYGAAGAMQMLSQVTGTLNSSWRTQGSTSALTGDFSAIAKSLRALASLDCASPPSKIQAAWQDVIRVTRPDVDANLALCRSDTTRWGALYPGGT